MNQREMDDFMSNIISRVNNKEVMDNIISTIMNPDYNVGLRRRLVIISRLKSSLLNNILDKQQKIKRKHCR